MTFCRVTCEGELRCGFGQVVRNGSSEFFDWFEVLASSYLSCILNSSCNLYFTVQGQFLDSSLVISDFKNSSSFCPYLSSWLKLIRLRSYKKCLCLIELRICKDNWITCLMSRIPTHCLWNFAHNNLNQRLFEHLPLIQIWLVWWFSWKITSWDFL